MNRTATFYKLDGKSIFNRDGCCAIGEASNDGCILMAINNYIFATG